MKYVALLRGINVGGNNIIKMLKLKECFEKKGYTNVLTYINSGNVIFESEEKNAEKLTSDIEQSLLQTFTINLKIILRSHTQLKRIVEDVPEAWKKSNDLRCYVGFIKEPTTVEDVLKEITLKENVDSIKTGHGVIYMSTKLSGLTKSGFTKLAGKKIYQSMTIRNFNTTQKLLSLMEK